MVLLTAVGIAGLCYCAVFLEDFPENMTQFFARLVVKVFGALGLGSLISLLAFMSLGMAYRLGDHAQFSQPTANFQYIPPDATEGDACGSHP